MKKIIFSLIIAVLFLSCISTGKDVTNFSDAIGKEWKLLAVYVDSTPFGRRVVYDRNDLKKEKIGNVYTLTFSADTVSGMGAPNRYSAPYTRGDEQALEIGLIRATLMAPIVQPEKLQEHVYFGYLQSVKEWKIVSGKLELHSKTESGADVRLVFGQ